MRCSHNGAAPHLTSIIATPQCCIQLQHHSNEACSGTSLCSSIALAHSGLAVAVKAALQKQGSVSGAVYKHVLVRTWQQQQQKQQQQQLTAAVLAGVAPDWR
jgi:hypothetical protein